VACSAYLGVRLGCVRAEVWQGHRYRLWNHLVRLRTLLLSLPDHSKVEVLPTAYRVRLDSCSVGLSELEIIAVLSTSGPRNGCPSSIPVKASQK
jgi:hypothetical protein